MAYILYLLYLSNSRPISIRRLCKNMMKLTLLLRIKSRQVWAETCHRKLVCKLWQRVGVKLLTPADALNSVMFLELLSDHSVFYPSFCPVPSYFGQGIAFTYVSVCFCVPAVRLMLENAWHSAGRLCLSCYESLIVWSFGSCLLINQDSVVPS